MFKHPEEFEVRWNLHEWAPLQQGHLANKTTWRSNPPFLLEMSLYKKGTSQFSQRTLLFTTYCNYNLTSFVRVYAVNILL